MPVQFFHASDPEAFRQTANSPADFRLILRARGPVQGWRRRYASDGVIVTSGGLSLASTYEVGTTSYAMFTIMQSDGTSPIMQGRAVAAGTVALSAPGASIHWQFPAGSVWWNVRVSPERLQQASLALFGAPLPLGRAVTRFAEVPEDRWSALLAALRLALGGPPRRHSHLLTDGLLRLLLEGFDPFVTSTSEPGEGVHPRRQRMVDGLMRIGDVTDAPLSLLEVCTALEVPLRTLNHGSLAYLGMSAGQYLRRRRLHRVFAALCTGQATSVAEAAAEQGFWEAGRFAADFRRLFGENPSETLRRGRQGPRQ